MDLFIGSAGSAGHLKVQKLPYTIEEKKVSKHLPVAVGFYIHTIGNHRLAALKC